MLQQGQVFEDGAGLGIDKYQAAGQGGFHGEQVELPGQPGRASFRAGELVGQPHQFACGSEAGCPVGPCRLQLLLVSRKLPGVFVGGEKLEGAVAGLLLGQPRGRGFLKIRAKPAPRRLQLTVGFAQHSFASEHRNAAVQLPQAEMAVAQAVGAGAQQLELVGSAQCEPDGCVAASKLLEAGRLGGVETQPLQGGLRRQHSGKTVEQ